MLLLKTDTLDSVVAVALTSAQLAEMEERYGQPDELDGLAAVQLTPPSGTFIVAWIDDVAVGCGGLRRIDDATGEIKRMFVAAEARRRGVARALLAELEATARSLGYTRLVLETGIKQPEAIALYEAHGYKPIEPYGLYKDSPLSRCFAKSLA
jgi:GNAT superfamily N-acetyltransferase